MAKSKYNFFRHLVIPAMAVFSAMACSDTGLTVNGKTSTIRTPAPVSIQAVSQIKMQDFHIGDFNVIADSILISWIPNDPDAFFFVHSIEDGSLKGKFCLRGRGENETVATSPIFQTFKENGEIKAFINFHNEREIKIWNISRSVSCGKTVFEHKYPIAEKNAAYIEIFRGPDNSCICYSSSRSLTPHGNIASLPHFVRLSCKTGEMETVFNIFTGAENIIGETEAGKIPTPQDFLRSCNCMEPDGTRIAMGMLMLGQIIILDTADGSIHSCRIPGTASFEQFGGDLPDPKAYFTCIQCDKDRIYTLYSGEDFNNTQSGSDRIMIFDWEGNPVKNLKLEHKVKSFCISNGAVFTFDESCNSICKYDLNHIL